LGEEYLPPNFSPSGAISKTGHGKIKGQWEKGKGEKKIINYYSYSILAFNL